MPQINQTRPLGGRVGCDLFGDASHSPLTPSALRSQLFTARYAVSPWLAQDLASLCFGEGCCD